MVSATQQTSRIRNRKARRAGAARKRALRAQPTPTFTLHPAAYDSTPPAPRPVERARPGADAPDAPVARARPGADAPDAPVARARPGADAPDAPAAQGTKTAPAKQPAPHARAGAHAPDAMAPKPNQK